MRALESKSVKCSWACCWSADTKWRTNLIHVRMPRHRRPVTQFFVHCNLCSTQQAHIKAAHTNAM